MGQADGWRALVAGRLRRGGLRWGLAMADGGGLFGGLFGAGGARTGDTAWLQAMLDTEAALARAAERAGVAAAGSGAAVTAAADASLFDLDALGQAAARTGNPVPALVRELRSLVNGPAARAVHAGATSQDILDTAAMLLARQSLTAILADLARAADAAAALAAEHDETIMIGRTLLQQAVPVTFGLVAAGWLTGLDEAREDVARVAATRLAVQFGGAAGTLAALGEAGPRVAGLLAEELGLAAPPLPWHTGRLRLVQVAAAAAGAAAVTGKLARDVTLLAQSEIAEVSEGGEDRGGSSAMPHKHNPVVAILILGCTKRIPGLLATLAAAAEQEHQRAAGAWHAEWETFADLLRLTGSAAAWTADLLGGLRVDAHRMRANLDAAGGFPMAEQVAALLAPVLGPTQAHDLVARASASAALAGLPLADALTTGETGHTITAAGITKVQLSDALDPAAYLGSASVFTQAALAAHRATTQRLSQPDSFRTG
jgi:3-carboxy-cis,cis-muconate cycloisomerase